MLFTSFFIFLLFFVSSLGFAKDSLKLSANHLDEPLMKNLIELFHVNILVETGTSAGDTAYLGQRYFKEVHTIELGPEYYEAKKRFQNSKNVYCYRGDSGEVLTKILPELQGRVLFWLDAHYSGGATVKGNSETALQDEIQSIRNSGIKDAVILDIRFYHPKQDHVPECQDWPSVKELKSLILTISSDYEFWIIGDMAIAYPKADGIGVSPLVRACTSSRFCETSDAYNNEVIEQENIISTVQAAEIRVIDRLYKMFVDPLTERRTYHYILWKGLVAKGNGEYKIAENCFKRVIDAGYVHPRINAYLQEVRECL